MTTKRNIHYTHRNQIHSSIVDNKALDANYILYESTRPLSGKTGQPSGLLKYKEGTYTNHSC